MTTIINIKSGAKYDLYCGRANKYYNQLEDSIFCNPFVIGKDGSREEVIKKFEEYAPTNKVLMDNLYLIDDKILSCYCDYPNEDCHCRILINLRQEQLRNKKYKVAVVGSRSIKDKIPIFDYLNTKKDKIDLIITGGALGVDSHANDWCKANGFPCLIYYPKWYNDEGEYDKGAGFKRNYLIIKDSDIVVVFWDGKSKGTAHDIDIAKQMGKKLIINKIEINND